MSRQPPFEFSAFKSPESLLLILKEALNVIHNEIKRGKNSLASVFSPPQALCPSLSHQIIWMWRGRGRQQQEKCDRESRWMGRGQVKNNKIHKRKSKYESFPPLLQLWSSPQNRWGSLGALLFWWMTGPLPDDPGTCAGGRGEQEAESEVWLEHVCAFCCALRYNVAVTRCRKGNCCLRHSSLVITCMCVV